MFKKRKLPKTYKGRLTKKQREREKQKVGLAILLGIATVFSCYLLTEITYAEDWNPASVNVYKAPKRLPEAQKVNLDEIGMERQIQIIAQEYGFKWADYLVRLAKCESSLNPLAVNDNGAYGLDRGLFQINNFYHPYISDECAFDIRCSTEWTMEQINNGKQSWWVCDNIIRQ